MKTMLRNLLVVLAIVGWASAAPAAVLFTEDFSYQNGALGTVSGGLWTGPPVVPLALNVSNGKVTLFHVSANCCGTTITKEDPSRGYSALTAGQTLYAGLDVSASGNNSMGGPPPSALRFADNGATQLFVTAFTGSDFTFGISGFGPAASWPNGLAFGATYRVVMSYEFDSGISKLWVNPANESSTYVSFTDSASRPLSAFTLWQRSTPTGTPSADQVLDNLVLGTTFNDVLSVPVSVFGDYNNNGTVDAADYVMWRNGGPLANEVDVQGTVNGADYTAWRARFGNPGGGGGGGSDASAIAAVPEPATSVLLLFAMAGWCLQRGRAA